MNRREIATSAGLVGVLGGVLGPIGLAVAPARAAAASGEGNLARILRTKKLRMAGVAAEEPYFHKDIATGQWGGFCVEMGRDIANELGVALEIWPTTWGNSVLDLETNKIDISFGLNPTPKRALVVDFPPALFYNTSSFIGRKGFTAATWAELDRPEVRIAFDLGTSREVIVRHYAPKATLIGFRTSADGLLAVAAGHADCFVCTVFLGLAAKKTNPNLGDFFIPEPYVRVVTTAAIQYDSDLRFHLFMGAWADYNRSSGQMRAWILNGLALVGVQPKDVPPEVEF